MQLVVGVSAFFTSFDAPLKRAELDAEDVEVCVFGVCVRACVRACVRVRTCVCACVRVLQLDGLYVHITWMSLYDPMYVRAVVCERARLRAWQLDGDYMAHGGYEKVLKLWRKVGSVRGYTGRVQRQIS